VPFHVRALPRAEVEPWLKLDDMELAKRDARWMVADAAPGYPCRVSLTDAEVGERVLLFPYAHHDIASPYKGAGPIFVRERAKTATFAVNEVPTMLRHRQLSFRGYDQSGMMLATQVSQGDAFEEVIEGMLKSREIAYIHVHNAGPGCFNCEVRRA
jgi:hypothetical protein